MNKVVKTRSICLFSFHVSFMLVILMIFGIMQKMPKLFVAHLKVILYIIMELNVILSCTENISLRISTWHLDDIYLDSFDVHIVADVCFLMRKMFLYLIFVQCINDLLFFTRFLLFPPYDDDLAKYLIFQNINEYISIYISSVFICSPFLLNYLS